MLAGPGVYGVLMLLVGAAAAHVLAGPVTKPG